MSAIDDAKRAIQTLSPEELAAFRAWFAEFDAQAWDRQLAEDAASGRLDSLAKASGLALNDPDLIEKLDARFADSEGAIPWNELRDQL